MISFHEIIEYVIIDPLCYPSFNERQTTDNDDGHQVMAKALDASVIISIKSTAQTNKMAPIEMAT
jgi:hypothetical protein